MPFDFSDGIQHRLSPDSAGADLVLNHGLSLGSKIRGNIRLGGKR